MWWEQVLNGDNLTLGTLEQTCGLPENYKSFRNKYAHLLTNMKSTTSLRSTCSLPSQNCGFHISCFCGCGKHLFQGSGWGSHLCAASRGVFRSYLNASPFGQHRLIQVVREHFSSLLTVMEKKTATNNKVFTENILTAAEASVQAQCYVTLSLLWDLAAYWGLADYQLSRSSLST